MGDVYFLPLILPFHLRPGDFWLDEARLLYSRAFRYETAIAGRNCQDTRTWCESSYRASPKGKQTSFPD